MDADGPHGSRVKVQHRTVVCQFHVDRLSPIEKLEPAARRFLRQARMGHKFPLTGLDAAVTPDGHVHGSCHGTEMNALARRPTFGIAKIALEGLIKERPGLRSGLQDQVP